MPALKIIPSPAILSNSPVRTPGNTGEFYLGKLAALGVELARTAPGSEAFFAGPLNIVQEAMGFSLSVIYRVENPAERRLILEVAGVLDPAGRRPALVRGARIAIDLDHPESIFRNEAQAFLSRGVAAVNVPGTGCDIAGYVSAGATASDGYVLAGISDAFFGGRAVAPSLAELLRKHGHEAEHVFLVLPPNARDRAIWDFALKSNFVLVTKDEDFADWSHLRQPAPLVVWLRIGNLKKAALQAKLEPLLPDIARRLKAGETLIEVF